MDSQASPGRRGLLTLAAAALCTLGFAASAHAMTTYNVTAGDASSLLNAVDQANTDGDDSTVNVPAGTYNLSPSDEMEIFGDGTFTLTGAGARSTIIDGGGGPVSPGAGPTTSDSLFYISAFNPMLCKSTKIISCVSPADATISGITVQNVNDDEDGGAFYVENAGSASLAALHLYDSTLTNNQSDDDGGGIYNEGTLDVKRVTFSNNYAMADGAAIATKGFSELSPSRGTVSANFATTRIENSTFTGNISDSDTGCEGGGAIEQENGNTTIINSTIVGNTSWDGTCEHVQPTGGGIDIEAGPSSIVNTIISGNTASPGQKVISAGSVQPRQVRGAIGPAGPVLPSNCSVDPAPTDGNTGSIVSQGHNIESATDCGFTAAGDQQNTDPNVGSLANNGGQMDTMALLGGSPAIDRADSANCPATDEIGTTRPQGAACDVGAFEVIVPPAPPPVTPPAKPAAPKVGVAGVRRACVSSSFHIRFHVATTASVKRVVVKLDGKRIKSTTKSSFTLTVNGKKLSAGRHRLTISATDSAGQTTTTHKSFSVCKAAKPRRKAAPRFTG